MPAIQGNINGVLIEFSPNVNKDVDQKIIDALKQVITPNIVTNYTLRKISISSANDQHKLPSRHLQGAGKAVDISRINSMKMAIFYSSNPAGKAITDAIQTEFENDQHKRENFGPLFKKKLGKSYSISGHKDHIHFSVN